MDKYLERITTALETIAGALTGNKITSTASTAAPAAVSTEMPAPTPKGRKKATETAAAPATEAPAAPAAPAPAANTPTSVEIAEAVRKLVASDATGGHAKALGILNQFGAKRISELKPENFPEVIKKINELLAATKK